ncbi:MAG: phosphogluconate dehydrogenase C-terminal domain-containing protein [Armatimonadota bacterium]|nr:phosphogluconate dehydrogenase C-terminal domain-containing protein [Armatimonadota bacterium]
MRRSVALIGAGGKMGSRIADNLTKNGQEANRYEVFFCEKSEAAARRLEEKGVQLTSSDDAVRQSDFVILAVPDALIGSISSTLCPLAKPGTTFVLLDPAAAALGEVAIREGLNYVACHPCHPPLFFEQPTPEARRDLFGGVAAIQDIVIALISGAEEAYEPAKELCETIFAPVRNAYRITVEQMAILEPAMAEVVAASAACLMRDAMEEAIKAGVPREAAYTFMMGHAQIALAIAFGAISSPFSDAAKVAIRWGTERIINPNWRCVFEPDQIRAVIREMLSTNPDRKE